MVSFPIDKYLAQDYRNTLRTGDSPQNLDTDAPLLPVIDIQKGFPRPNSKQVLKHQNFYLNTNAASQTQLATVSSTKKVYFIGFISENTGAGVAFQLQDATSGAVIGTGSGDTTILTPMLRGIATLTNRTMFMPLPVECINGLRVCGQAPAGGDEIIATIYWLEEII